MPLHIPPKSLEKITFNNVKNLIVESSVNIESRFGSFDHDLCKEAVNDLQNYLVMQIRPYLDSICDDTDLDNLRKLDDKRIFYSLVVHNKTKLLNLNSLLNRCPDNSDCFQTFCIDLISKVDNLMSLHISKTNVSTKVLKAIAATSYMSLEELIISPMLTEFCDGFECLSQCQELKYLEILTFSENEPTDNCLKRLQRLIKSLPKLQYFDSCDMIKILSRVEVANPLPLVKLKGRDPNFPALCYIVKMCPKLEDIDISVLSSSSSECKCILNAITSSSLPLTTLALRGFSEVDHLLSTKGACLTDISITYPFRVVKCVNIYVIGKYCPNIKTLDLDFHDLGFDYETFEDTIEGAVATPPMFTKLECLCFGWYKVKTSAQSSVLPLILRDANQITVLKLQCCTLSSDQDALSELLCSNPLLMLAELSLIVNGPGMISRQSFSCLIDRCQRLWECYIYGHIKREAQVYVQKLYGRIQDENLDLKFDVFSR